MQTEEFRRHALLPKRKAARRPSIPAVNDTELSYLVAPLAPPERQALREIVVSGDLLMVDGGCWLLAPLSEAALDVIAAFEAEGDDLEVDAGDAEPDDHDEVDDEPEQDDHYGTLCAGHR